MQVGVIGCGNMGGGMLRQLLKEGLTPLCFDPNAKVLEQMGRAGATPMPSAAALAKAAQVILLSLPKAEVVEAVMEGIVQDVQPGAIVLDTSTSVPATSQKLAAQASARGFHFVDGPVSGGPAAANAGTMTMLLGGMEAPIAQLRPILDILTAKTVWVGGSGAGHAAKIANNMLCAANLVLVSEAVKLGEAAGVRAADLLEGINAGSGRSGVSEVNFPKWILNGSFDSGFTMGLMRKDVGLALDLAEATGVPVPGFAGVADIWTNQSRNVPDEGDFNEIVTYVERGQGDV